MGGGGQRERWEGGVRLAAQRREGSEGEGDSKTQMEGPLKEEEGLDWEGLGGMGVSNGKGSREPRACKEADLRESRGLLYSTGTSAQYYVTA